MPSTLHYAVRMTIGDYCVRREVLKVVSVEQLNNLTHNAAPDGAKVETKFLGHGAPIYKSRGRFPRAFHTEEQRKTYEQGLTGHGCYDLEHGPLDNFNYLGAQDAEVLSELPDRDVGDEV